MLANFARYAEQDVKGQLAFYDHDNDGVIEYDWGALTGNDADAVSFHWRSGRLDRAEAAYVYSDALAAAQAYDALGNTAKAERDADARQPDPQRHHQPLWNPTRQLLEHRHVATNAHVPWKEINNYYPYAVGADAQHRPVPAGAAPVRRPGRVPDLPVLHRQPGATRRPRRRPASPGSNNFSTINSTVQFRLYSSVLRNYPNQWMTTEDYKKLLYWNAWAQYVGGNTAVAGRQRVLGRLERRRRSSTTAPGSTTTSSAAATGPSSRTSPGLRPRNDNQVELSPINIGWSHFAVEQPALPQRRPVDRLGRPGRRRDPLHAACRRATRSTSTAPGRSPSTG